MGVSFGQIRWPDENPIQFVLTNRSETPREFFRGDKSLFRSLVSISKSSAASICRMILITADIEDRAVSETKMLDRVEESRFGIVAK